MCGYSFLDMPDAAPVQYQRLSGSGLARKGSFIAAVRTSCRLWLGDDHLLQVESAGGYSETYKRFYFRDIQAVFLQKTSSWLVVNWILGCITGLFLLWTLTVKETAGIITLGIITGIFGFFLALNFFRGPTCNCLLKTAVHLEEIPSLRRRRNAEKVLARIRPLIEAAQGSATAETVAPQYAALLATANATPAVSGQFSRVVDPTLTPYRSRAHSVLFSALLADALADVLNIFLPSVPVIFIGMITGAVLVVAVLVALVKQNQTDLKPAVRVVTWISTGFTAIGYFTGYIIMVVAAPREHFDGTQWGYVKALANLKPLETPWWLGVLSVSAAIAGLLGGLGLLLLRRHWREKEIPA
jgi:hypothetical protein